MINIPLKSSVCALIILALLSSYPAPSQYTAVSQADKRPNILFVIMDDWSWPHAGAYGDKVVHTPAFDRIAREGVLFTNAYCVLLSGLFCKPGYTLEYLIL